MSSGAILRSRASSSHLAKSSSPGKGRARLRVVVVEDQGVAREHLKRFIRAANFELVAEASGLAAAVQVLPAHVPDVLFLDVRLGDDDGIKLARECRPWFGGLVFTTGQAAHAAEAFELGAIDYLVKPFDDLRFRMAVGRIERHFDSRTAREELAVRPKATRLLIRQKGELVIVKPQTVDWFEAYGDCVKIHIGDRTLVDHYPLASLERVLDPRGFVRIHRSAIINLERVRSIRPGRFGDGTVVLSTGAEVSMSRYYRRALLSIC